jgi:hypothetical protein
MDMFNVLGLNPKSINAFFAKFVRLNNTFFDVGLSKFDRCIIES